VPAETAAGTPPETEDLYGAYPRLSAGQVATLASLGQRRRVEADETLIQAGDLDCDFYVILAGKAAVVEGRGSPFERLVSVHDPRRFLGELGLLTGEATFYTAVAVEPGERMGYRKGQGALAMGGQAGCLLASRRERLAFEDFACVPCDVVGGRGDGAGTRGKRPSVQFVHCSSC
jgi:CRP-like cAMP-binding protein